VILCEFKNKSNVVYKWKSWNAFFYSIPKFIIKKTEFKMIVTLLYFLVFLCVCVILLRVKMI
jgi:hypothetical protein